MILNYNLLIFCFVISLSLTAYAHFYPHHVVVRHGYADLPRDRPLRLN